MVQIDLGAPVVWLIVLALAVGCFALRLSFIQLYGWLGGFPPAFERALAYLPPAILAAITLSQLHVPAESLVGAVVNARVIAAALAAGVAWRTGSMLATIGVGMGAIWVLQLLLG